MTIKEEIIEAAKRQLPFHGIPWQIGAAVAGQESSFGQFLSAPFNCIGTKRDAGTLQKPGSPKRTKEFSNTSHEETITATFCAYQSWDFCMDHLARKLAYQSAYRPVKLAIQGMLDWQNPTEMDLLAACNALGPIWATDALYSKQLMAIIRREGWIAAKDNGGVA